VNTTPTRRAGWLTAMIALLLGALIVDGSAQSAPAAVGTPVSPQQLPPEFAAARRPPSRPRYPREHQTPHLLPVQDKTVRDELFIHSEMPPPGGRPAVVGTRKTSAGTASRTTSPRAASSSSPRTSPPRPPWPGAGAVPSPWPNPLPRPCCWSPTNNSSRGEVKCS